MRIAVVDLGTNTCNLLVAELNGTNYTILHQSKKLVKLGDNKIKENEISAAATKRTVASFLSHKKMIEEYGVERVKVIATSAVRTAENRIAYLEELGNKSGWLVKLVSGEREAELIFKGVLLAFRKLNEPSLILDIGGGSNELILALQKEQVWKESRPTGMARVINKFTISDPILPEEIKILEEYFKAEHKQAIEKCKEKSVTMLIGCSGAFDTVADLIDGVYPGEKQRTTQVISMQDFGTVYKSLITSTREQRRNMKGMDEVRLDLIVPAIILIHTIISATDIQAIVQTDFALREGVLSEYMHKRAIELDGK